MQRVMGKTPQKKANERRRPYNYLRNTHAQGQFSGSGTESRNYYYTSGSVQRTASSYHRVHTSASNQFYRSPFRGELYRERVSNIPRFAKPVLGRRLPSKKVVPPTKRKMQAAAAEEQNSQQKDGASEPLQPEQQPKEEDHGLKNGPAAKSESDVNEYKEKMENGLSADPEEDPEKPTEQNAVNMEDGTNPAPKTKSGSKEKKASKTKGKHSPKTGKDKKIESAETKKIDKPETDRDEIEGETKEKKATKKSKKETETDQQQTSIPDMQPNVRILRMNTEMLINADMNDSSVVEIPVEDAQEKEDALPSTSSDWPETIRSSPRRSTRLQEQKGNQDESVIMLQQNDQDDSILILENEQISVTEVSRHSRNGSFGEVLCSLRGRRSLRPLPPLNVSLHRRTAELRSSLLNKSLNRDPSEALGQEYKGNQSRSVTSTFHKSNKSITTTTSDLAADNDLDDSANNSAAEESSSEFDSTSAEPPSATDENVTGKRKMSNINSLDELQQETKRFRASTAEQRNSSGFLSMISSPMNAFASRIKSGKSSTPVHLVKVSALAEEEQGHMTEDVSEITNEDMEENGESFNKKSKKESLEVVTEGESSQLQATSRKWCNIM